MVGFEEEAVCKVGDEGDENQKEQVLGIQQLIVED